MRFPFFAPQRKTAVLNCFTFKPPVFFFDRNRSVQTDLLTGEQSLDSCLEWGKLRGVQAVRSLNDGSAACWASRSVSRSICRLATFKSGSPCWRLPKKSPGPRRARSCSAILKPSGRLAERLQALFCLLVFRPADQHAVGLRAAAPDASAQLMQLTEAEALGILNDHQRRVRHIHADLHDRCGDENIVVSRAERAQRRVLFPRFSSVRAPIRREAPGTSRPAASAPSPRRISWRSPRRPPQPGRRHRLDGPRRTASG